MFREFVARWFNRRRWHVVDEERHGSQCYCIRNSLISRAQMNPFVWQTTVYNPWRTRMLYQTTNSTPPKMNARMQAVAVYCKLIGKGRKLEKGSVELNSVSFRGDRIGKCKFDSQQRYCNFSVWRWLVHMTRRSEFVPSESAGLPAVLDKRKWFIWKRKLIISK